MGQTRESMVLFLCTGNYYRSRFAELFFNHVAATEGLAWWATSRGLALERGVNNHGPMSRVALRALQQLGIQVPESLRLPLAVGVGDLEQAGRIVALKEAEHRPLFIERHPAWTEKVEFWHIHDVDQATPEEALPQIQAAVIDLVRRLRAAATGPRAVAPLALYESPYFTFRFADSRRIPRFHLEGIAAGRKVRVYAADPDTLQPGRLLSTGIVGEGGWVDLPEAILVRAEEVFVVFPADDAETRGERR
jgi:protein-tyrosine phosphatase